LKKLKYNFIYHRRPDLARGCTLQHILTILKLEGIEFQDQLELVKTISPNFDPIKNEWQFKVVFKTGSSPPGSELINKRIDIRSVMDTVE